MLLSWLPLEIRWLCGRPDTVHVGCSESLGGSAPAVMTGRAGCRYLSGGGRAGERVRLTAFSRRGLEAVAAIGPSRWSWFRRGGWTPPVVAQACKYYGDFP